MEKTSDIGKVNCRAKIRTRRRFVGEPYSRLALRVQRNASVMESVSALPFASQNEISVRFSKQPQCDEFISLGARNLSVSEAETPSRVRSESAIRSVRFISIRQILARFAWRLAGKNAINVSAIIADILPALHPNGRNRARSDSQIIFAEPVRAIMN